MTTSSSNDKRTSLLFGIIFLIFIALRFIGYTLLDNNWSFTHVLFIPLWYYTVPLFTCTALYFLFKKKSDLLENLLNNRIQQILLFLFFFFLFIAFQFDSFAYGGGNYKINQIAQSETILFRFYELGTVFIVSTFFKLTYLFDIDKNIAGVISWKLFSYIGMLLTFLASILLSKTLCDDKQNRFLLFTTIFLGPQSLSYFGFISHVSLIPALVYFFIYLGLKFESDKSWKNIGFLWLLVAISCFIHISLLLMLPALIFTTLKKFIKQKNYAFILGMVSYLVLVASVFYFTSHNFEFSKNIIFLDSLNLRVNYSLFSFDHVIDFLQLLLLFVPQIIIVKFLLFKNFKIVHNTFRYQMMILLVISSNTLLFIMEPTHSIILDAPMFAVYFAPIVVLLAMLINQSKQHLKFAALFAVCIPLTTLPSYIDIDTAEKQVEKFLENNHPFYIEGSTALQDSYFQMGELDKANYWYLNLPKRSRDYLDITAAGEFSYAKMYPEALRLYYQLKTKAPFWGEPRYQIATILMKQKQYNLARSEIDTCLLINPYEKEYLKLDYAYYRDVSNFNLAKEKLLYTLKYYPNDFSIQTDLAIIYYRLKDIVNSEQTASNVIAQDSTQAYAYLIKGFIAEIKQQPSQAITSFKKFVKYAPEEPETPDIRKRLNNLILQEQGR